MASFSLGVVKHSLSGDALTKELHRLLESKGTTIKPQFCIERKPMASGGFRITELDFPNITKSYYNYMMHVYFPHPTLLLKFKTH